MEKVALCLLSIVYCASCLHVISIHDEQKILPDFPSIYVANATLKLPYAEIVEPITIWYDGNTTYRSRIDYYDGMMKTYQRGDLDPPVNQKVAYFTNETVYNMLTCFEVSSNGTPPCDMPQSILPNMTGFDKYLGQKVFNDQVCDVWEQVSTIGYKVNTYRFWAFNKTTTNKYVPVRLEMFGRNVLFGGSHYDKYELVYTEFEEKDEIDSSVFEMDDGVECHGFPGPGSEQTVLVNPMQEFINGEQDYVDSMFSDFKELHNKTYDTDQEHYERQNNFLHNLRYIYSHNRAGKSFSLAMNHMGDWTKNEMKILRGRIPTDPTLNDGQEFDISQYDQKIPSTLDWRLFGAVTPVKDQAVCGSCWSFGTTGTIEGANFVKTQNLEVLSQQALVDCSWGFGNNGCDGGEDYRAYRWIKKHGLPKAAAYGPYLGVDGKCHNVSNNDRVFITDYVNVTSRDVKAVKVAMFHSGPLSVSIDASLKSFSFYSSGVYDDTDCKSDEDSLDHSVLAVGYGVILDKPYWLVKNSWSTYWGNDGYILISQGHDCGVTTQSTFVIL